MRHGSRYGLLLVLASVAIPSTTAQTSKYLPGDTLLVPAETTVDVIGGEDFKVADTLYAVLIGKRYPFWFIDFNVSNETPDSTKVGNSFFLKNKIRNISLVQRDRGLEHNRTLSRMGVDVQRVGGDVERVISQMADAGIPVLLKFTFAVSTDGGVEPRIRVYNISDRRIRSMNIDFQGFDGAGNLVQCTRSGKSEHEISVKGPIDSEAECYFAFVNDPAFFNELTECLEIDSVTVEFVGGESVVLKEDLAAIQELLKQPFKRQGECRTGGSASQ